MPRLAAASCAFPPASWTAVAALALAGCAGRASTECVSKELVASGLAATVREGACGAVPLAFAPPPADNPLRGLVPYVTADEVERFPHSLEFDYLPLAALMTGPETFDWAPLEALLGVTSARGRQLVVRVFVEYPGRDDGIPAYLLAAGLGTIRWADEANGGEPSVTPDYGDPRLGEALTRFVRAFGARYDGDPRLGFVTAGLLGSWGEWHTYPRSELFASKALQRAILDAYEAAFVRTPVLLRYPAGEDDPHHAPNAGRRFGYHDDSFGWATLDTGREGDSWYFVPLLRAAGALDAWRTRPIGGELRPELWATSFTAAPHPEAQDFARCVEETHASWLMDSGLFSPEFPLSRDRRERALDAVARMGYVLHVASARVEGAALELVVENRGVAPFYADWKAELSAFRRAPQGTVAGPVAGEGAALHVGWRVAGLMPGEAATWRATLPESWRGAELRVRVPNPMPGGRPLRFANREQAGEWLVLPVRM